MYGMDTHITVKTLIAQGVSHRQIAQTLGIHRKVIRRILRESADGTPADRYHRPKKLEAYQEQILSWLQRDWSSELIHQHLVREHGVKVSYPTVNRWVRALRSKEAFVPMHSAVGEEAQVDFGYLGVFTRADGTRVKIWVFCLVLSYSRYGYYEAVTNQSVETFIRCHLRAFEFLAGVPRQIRLDNLKAGVTTPDFFEPLIQEQYAEFLAHYGAAAVPCRVRMPEHKGKVEAGVKYVKNNFLRGLEHREHERLSTDLRTWTQDTANVRVHGTTKRQPTVVYAEEERATLLPLPAERYTIYQVEERTVTRFGHVTFRNNYYSVPYGLVEQVVRLYSTGTLLRIRHGTEEVALHAIASGQKGAYITQPAHLPPHKQAHTTEAWVERLEQQIGPNAVALLHALQQADSCHWKEKINGVFQLRRQYPAATIDAACRRALDFHLYSYRAVRDIAYQLEHTALAPTWDGPPPGAGGFAHDLSQYDRLLK